MIIFFVIDNDSDVNVWDLSLTSMFLSEYHRKPVIIVWIMEKVAPGILFF